MKKNANNRRVAAALLLSFLIHLLLLFIYQEWAREPVEQVLHPLRFRLEQEAPELFRPSAPQMSADVQMQRLEREEVPSELPVDAVDRLEVVDELHVPLPAEEVDLSVDEVYGVGVSRDTLSSLDEMQLEMVRRRTEELEQYERLWLPDADTSDVESRSRLLAQEVVQRAIEAMGGVVALTAIRDMSYQGRYHKAYGTHSKYAQFLPGGAKVIFDGERGWIDVFGEAYPLKERGLHEVEYRAERWDFLSRYLGEGIQLSYVEKWSDLDGRMGPAGRAYHVLLVEDFKFGAAFRALFDEETHLLRAEEHPAEKPSLRETYLDYGVVDRAYIWMRFEMHRLNQLRYAKSQASVSYAEIDGAVFAVSEADSGWGWLHTYESKSKLWVDVQMTNWAPSATGVLPGATSSLNVGQREMVRQQVEDELIEDLSRRELFPDIEPLKDAWMSYDLRKGDFVLEVTLDAEPGLLYQARLFEASKRLQIMQDGPPVYFGYVKTDRIIRPECLFYTFRTYTVENDIAYVDRKKILEILQGSYDKIQRAVKEYESGERNHFQFLRKCCYCLDANGNMR